MQKLFLFQINFTGLYLSGHLKLKAVVAKHFLSNYCLSRASSVPVLRGDLKTSWLFAFVLKKLK
jgi:hypothetical protein